MKKTILLWCVLFFLATDGIGQVRVPDGGGAMDVPTDHITESMRAEIEQQLRFNIDSLQSAGVLSKAKAITQKFDWPLRAEKKLFDYDYHGVSNFVDLNGLFPDQITDYTCGARSYDRDNGYNHAGTDFFTWPFSWNKMRDDEVAVIAAAPGVIIQKIDGNQDQSCSFNSQSWNAVYIRHADGSVAWYGHLKKNSLTERNIGSEVESGEYLGIVGSSGNSTGPHLHFELHDENGVIVDPFKGSCNDIEQSLWNNQRDYFDSGINALRTQSAGPLFMACPNPDIENYKDAFLKGEQIISAAYYRDQLEGQTAFYSVIQPSGDVLWSWSGRLSEVEHYSASYWWWQNDLPATAPVGIWKFEANFLNETYTHEFSVSDENTKPLAVHLQNPVDKTEVEGGTERFRWLPLADADEYEFVLASDREFTEVVVSYTVTERSISLKNLDDGEIYYWRVRANNEHGTGNWSPVWSFSAGVATSVDLEDELPEGVHLSQNYPNPFNPTTQIQYQLPSTGFVKLSVFNALGREVEVLVESVKSSGAYSVTFDASELPSGVYYMQLKTPYFVEVKPMTLIK